jgi:phosphomannomutase
MVRPSGTEPKLKYYFYALSRPSDRVDLTASEQAARSIVQSMVEDLVPPAAR